MKNFSFCNWLGKIPQLTDNQREVAVAEIECKGTKSNVSPAKSGIPPAIADAAAKCCPNCDHDNVVKNGFASGLQRWKCKGCSCTFNILTKTPLARLRKKEKWLTYAQAMIDGLSVRRAAEVCGVNYNTTFLWRHRFAENLGKAQCTDLNGIAESDVTLFYRSEKGRKVKDRKVRQRGGHNVPKGYGPHLVSVITLCDRHGLGAERVASEKVTLHAADLYSFHLCDDTILITDGDTALCAAIKSINKAAEARNPFAHKALVGAKSRGKKGNPYHIQTVNSFHSHLKRWMERFHGVATEYLENYVGWHRHLMEKHHNNDPNLFIQLAINPLSMHPQLTMI